ncbi:MAG TPA: DoxX family protein [Tahibacter sp.]|jgi:putative oxidoreductase|nr:DoxX family protein [Tahibacter sp.]
MSIVASTVNAWDSLNARLRGAGEVLPRFVLRLIMGWEFWESGLEKLHGENWFADIQTKFPWPFNIVPADLSWGIATWFEIIGGLALWLGLGTRVFAFVLLFLTFVATAAVHWPDMWTMWSDLLKGYSITDAGHGNFKLPLLFVVMLLPLIFNGPGKFSVDYLIARSVGASTYPAAVSDFFTWAIAAAVIGLPFLMLMPLVGATLLGLAAVLALLGRYAR